MNYGISETKKIHIANVLLFILIHTGWSENAILNPLLKKRHYGNYIETGSDSCNKTSNQNGIIEFMLIENIVNFSKPISKKCKKFGSTFTEALLF